jgi:RHS repeat-associated protein
VSAYLSESGQTIAYTYDAAGFATSRGGVPIGWTATGRMSSFGADSMQWDASGRLMWSHLGGIHRDFSRFGGRIEFNPANGAFVSLDLGAVSIDLVSGARTYRHLDFRGNVKFTSDNAGAITSHIRYSPYGVDEVFGTSSNAAQFAGGQSLGSLVQLGARVYDPEVGRFLSPDPVFQMLNQHSYTSGNPVLFSDRTGLHESPNSGLSAEAEARLARLDQIADLLEWAAFSAAAIALVTKDPRWAGVALVLEMGAWVIRQEIEQQRALMGKVSSGVSFSVDATVPTAFQYTVHEVWRDDPGQTQSFASLGAGGGPNCAPDALSRVPGLGPWLLPMVGLQILLAVVWLSRRRRETRAA